MTESPQDKLRASLVRALQEVERLRKKVASLEQSAHEPIAIVGIGLRLPGGIVDLSSLWSALEREVDAVGPIPGSRWDAESLYDEDPDRVGKCYVREAAFLDSVDGFDPAFFNISPREATAIDPQHRLLLEASWEALEDAGIVPGSLRETRTGVFVGIGPSDYALLGPSAVEADAHGIMTHSAFAAGRIAFALGLQGPAVSLDTACSSSLVALHLACNSLRADECSVALAAGVQVLAAPDNFILLSRTRALAPDGRSKTFSDRANGYGRGEGVVVLALERLSVAQSQGRRILALVRGSAVNHDGPSSSITAPNGTSQQKVLRAALADAQIRAVDVDVVECHGTGTSLGDPIEIQALASVYGEGRSPERPLALGAIKTNIGHLESAAGLAGVAKMIASMRRGTLPATIHTNPRNRHIEWSDLPVTVVDSLRPWPAGADEPRRAGISAFGLSGTNAHVIVEQAPAESSSATSAPLHPVPVLLSARSAEALRGQVARLERWLADRIVNVGELAASLAGARSHFEHRLVIATADSAGLLEDLRGHLDNRGSSRSAQSIVRGEARLALLFTGQGAQRLGMGRGLADAYPVFRAAFEEASGHFDRLLSRPLRAVMHGDDAASLDRTEYTQPALFALEVALFRLYESWGIRPDVLLGHSIGEIAAAHVAGVLTLEDACKLVAARGRLMQALPEGGAMVSLQASEAEVLAVLREHEGVDVAGLNGPMATVVAGDEGPVLEIARHFEAHGRKATRLSVSHAFHSRRMDGMLEAFRAELKSLLFATPKLSVVSNVTGNLATAEELSSPDYWVRHVRQAVRFVDGVRTLEAQGVTAMLELGPRGVLTAMASSCLSEKSQERIATVASLRKDRDEGESVALALGTLHCHGVAVDWAKYFEPWAGSRVELPTYAFQRQRCWLEAPKVVRSESPRERAASWRYRETWRRIQETTTKLEGRPLLVVSTKLEREAWVAALIGTEAFDLAVVDEHAGRAELATRLSSHRATRIVSLLGFDESPHADASPVTKGLAQTLALAQALEDVGATGKLWLLTRGAVSVGEGDRLEHPRSAMIWGFGRVVGLEHPQRWGGLLDLPEQVEPALAKSVVEVVGREDGEDQLALRSEGLFVRRLERAPVSGGKPAPKLRGPALITGGTGALGAHTARWLAREGVESLILTSRRGLEAPGAKALQAELEGLGARVRVVACDVGEGGAVASLWETLERAGERPRAIFHAAGVGGSVGPLLQSSVDELEEVLAAKVRGAEALDAASRGTQLDAFVGFGSIAGVWGSGQQAAYSTGNAYLDALARHRVHRGEASTTVGWGPWAEGGLADEQTRAYLEQRGLSAMQPAMAVEALGEALRQNDATVVVADVAWERFVDTFAASRRRPLFDELLVRVAEPAREQASNEFVERLRRAPDQDRHDLVVDHVIAEVASVLGFADASQLQPTTGFSDLGLDSLMSVELRQRLARATGLKLPATLAFDFPTPDRVARLLLTELALEPRASVEAASSVEQATHEPIAIVGIGLRLPGGIVDLTSLWTALEREVDAVRTIPDDRWDVASVYDPDPEQHGKTYVREAGLLDDVTRFDPGFFNISPREARAIDPQHRLLLEAAWEALERAGVVPGSLRESRTGVFVGIGPSDYASLLQGSDDADAYEVMGTHASFAAGRVAFTLGLQGPALGVDTACSSSLVALHLACNSLRSGECSLALAGGVQVIASPHPFVALARTHALAPDGRSKTFSANADGYGRGEGVVVLALERLSTANERGHEVLALILGSAINHDGPSSGITAPNGTSQQKLLRTALLDAGLRPEDVDVVECHGTGTSLGDPIEVQALAAVYGEGRASDRPLLLGAVKTNVGHLESAAGLAGVAKVVAAMRHEALPATIHTRPRNPHIDWPSLNVEVVDRMRGWPRIEGRPRRAGVSAFGLSGTNAHVLVQEAPIEPAAAQPDRASMRGPVVLLLSGRTSEALADQASRLAKHRSESRDSIVDIAWSLATTRTAFEQRAACVCDASRSPVEDLELLASGGSSARIVGGRAKQRPKVALLFTGQGAQRLGMGRALTQTYPAFRAAFEDACGHFDRLLSRPLQSVMHGDDPALLDRTEYTQPALFALEVALFRLYESWGIRADVLLGHSIGEIAAAHVAGVLTLEDACKLVAARGRLMQALPEGGAMVSVQGSEAEVLAELEQLDGVDIAGLNGPLSTVVSGDEAAVLEVARRFEARGRKATRLSVSHAFHSRRMDGMLDAFRAELASLRFAAPKLSVVSNVTGNLATAEELSSPDYWVRHVRQAVRFVDGVRTLEAQGVTAMLELGPHGVLTAMAMGCLSDAGQERVATTTSLHKERDEAESVASALAMLHCQGVSVDWAKFFEPWSPARVQLPTYAFQRERYWLEPAKQRATDVGAAGLESSEHPLLKAVLELPDGDGYVFTTRLSLTDHPWLADHVVFEHVLFPGTGFLDLALAVASRVDAGRVEDLALESPLVLQAGAASIVRIVVAAADDAGRRRLSIFSKPDDAARTWTLHAAGTLASEPVEPSQERTSWPPPGAVELELAGMYEQLAEAGLAYGPGFRGLVRVWELGDVRHAEVRLPERLAAEGFCLHPALLDAALHALAPGRLGGTIALPFAWSGVSIVATGATQLRARFTPTGDGAYAIDLADASGRALARVDTLSTRPATVASIRDALTRRHVDSLHRVDWQPITSGSASNARHVLVGSDDRLASALGAARVANLDAVPEGVDVVVLPRFDPDESPLRASVALLESLQTWLADERRAASRLVVLTRRAIAVEPGEDVHDLAHAPLWGLVRSAQSEYADRALTIVDIDDAAESLRALAAAIASGEPQLALRGGRASVPRLAAVSSSDVLVSPPGARAWYLETPVRGTLESLQFVAHDELLEPLPAGRVRVRVRATGVNFRDVINALGMFPGDPGPLGYEGAGVVEAVGPGVESLAVGDRVFGMLRAGFGTHSVVDQRVLTRMPASWSFVEAASVPLVFLTAYHALVDLADLRPGQRILIHAAAGGVGMAATQLARHLGAEVFGTASPGKWDVLRERGFDDEHLANSRTLEFEPQFLAATQGAGVDVVLDALAREFVEASLRLLPRGGRFLEMGKTDVRDPDEVAREHPGVIYRAFDLIDAGFDRIQVMLRELVALFERGALQLLPIQTWDVRHAVEAFRFVAQAKHVGKVVLEAARSLDGEGTILITGGTGGLGSALARHLVARGSARNLLLTSRRGPEAPEAAALVGELERMGAKVKVVASDVGERAEVAALLAEVPEQHPLTAVIHTAGTLDDGLLRSQDADHFARVFGPKVDAVTHLHELTLGLDLAAFVVFSSVAGVLGSVGQANYAAANAHLDALCVHRRRLGHPALSLAWGPWAGAGMAARLSSIDRERMRRQGMLALELDQGLALLDVAMRRPEPALVPMRIDAAALARTGTLPTILKSLVRIKPQAVAAADASVADLGQQLGAMSVEEQQKFMIELVRGEAATVLGATIDSLHADRALQEHGLDSLMAVELRNRLQTRTRLRLPSTLSFDYPTPTAIASYLLGALAPSAVEREDRSDDELRRKIASIPIAKLRESGLLGAILQLTEGSTSEARVEEAKIDEMSVDELIGLALANEDD
jgi:acyl transferase domain-containing protein/NADPH:quinone reductase-like Zn-dependent oxidoreductase/acyl carrier protein